MGKLTIIKKDSCIRLHETLLDYKIDTPKSGNEKLIDAVNDKLVKQSLLLSNTMEDRNLTRVLNILNK